MANPSGRKGSDFELSLIPLLRKHMTHVVRLGKQGVKDKGDYYLPDPRYVLEAKNCVRLDLAGWLKEAETEAANAGKPYGVIVHKRKGTRDPAQQYVTCTLGTFLELLYAPLVGSDTESAA